MNGRDLSGSDRRTCHRQRKPRAEYRPLVTAQAADTTYDVEDPLFKFGFGLIYQAR